MPSPAKNQRDRVRDPREEILLETNFEDDGVLTRAYNNNPYNGTTINNRRRDTAYRSDYSLDRYTERGGAGMSCFLPIDNDDDVIHYS